MVQVTSTMFAVDYGLVDSANYVHRASGVGGRSTGPYSTCIKSSATSDSSVHTPFHQSESSLDQTAERAIIFVSAEGLYVLFQYFNPYQAKALISVPAFVISSTAYETERMKGRTVALTGAPSWPFTRGCKACLTTHRYGHHNVRLY